MAITIGKADPRFQSLQRGNNLRWPVTTADAPDSIELCETSQDVVAAVQRLVDVGRRPTIRSGGHCYEDFSVNNPGGGVIDLSLLNEPRQPGDETHRIGAGQRLSDVYLILFKQANVTIPAGTCGGVGAGGHISGGGYGLLSRLHGLTVDWLSAVDIVTVDEKGKAGLLRADKNANPDLFRACRGAGGGNFGVIINFLFDKLPTPPKEVVKGGVSFNWAGMTEARFVDIVMKFGEYWQTRGKEEDTWGLFSVLELAHSSARQFGLSLQFCNFDGTCRDLSIVNEFLDRFRDCRPNAEHLAVPEGRIDPQKSAAQKPCPGHVARNASDSQDRTARQPGRCFPTIRAARGNLPQDQWPAPLERSRGR